MCLHWVSAVNEMFEVLTVNEMQPISDILSVLQMLYYICAIHDRCSASCSLLLCTYDHV